MKIKDIIKTYNGEYYEKNEKKIHTPDGMYHSKMIIGNFEINELKFSIKNIYSEGIDFGIDPIKIFLKLKHDNKLKLEIYPKNIYQKVLDFIIGDTISKNSNYRLKGNKKLIKNLYSNKEFINELNEEKIYIHLSKNYIRLMPEYGIQNEKSLRIYINLLSAIENYLN